MSLANFFPKDIQDNFAERNIDIGKAILVKIKDFNISYPKYVIIVSFDDIDKLVAYVVINTDINNHVFNSPYLKSLHVLIDKENHNFLDYDSYVDCSKIREFDKHELVQFLIKNPKRAVGNVSSDVLKKIQNTITLARTIENKVKIKFGFA